MLCAVVLKLILEDFPRTQTSQNSRNLNLSSFRAPSLSKALNPFSLICLNLKYYIRALSKLRLEETLSSPVTTVPYSTYKPF